MACTRANKFFKTAIYTLYGERTLNSFILLPTAGHSLAGACRSPLIGRREPLITCSAVGSSAPCKRLWTGAQRRYVIADKSCWICGQKKVVFFHSSLIIIRTAPQFSSCFVNVIYRVWRRFWRKSTHQRRRPNCPQLWGKFAFLLNHH